MGFEPTPPRRLVPKTSALDRSATLPTFNFSWKMLLRSSTGYQLNARNEIHEECLRIPMEIECKIVIDVRVNPYLRWSGEHSYKLNGYCQWISLRTRNTSWLPFIHHIPDSCASKIRSTRMGFEPTRAEPNGLAVHRLNHTATASYCRFHVP